MKTLWRAKQQDMHDAYDIIVTEDGDDYVVAEYIYSEEDAKLIAAAPELLASLESILYDLDALGEVMPTTKKIVEQAIKKVKG